MDLSGRTVVGLYTGTAEEAAGAARQVEALGARYVDAGIQASPEAIGSETATIL